MVSRPGDSPPDWTSRQPRRGGLETTRDFGASMAPGTVVSGLGRSPWLLPFPPGPPCPYPCPCLAPSRAELTLPRQLGLSRQACSRTFARAAPRRTGRVHRDVGLVCAISSGPVLLTLWLACHLPESSCTRCEVIRSGRSMSSAFILAVRPFPATRRGEKVGQYPILGALVLIDVVSFPWAGGTREKGSLAEMARRVLSWRLMGRPVRSKDEAIGLGPRAVLAVTLGVAQTRPGGSRLPFNGN